MYRCIMTYGIYFPVLLCVFIPVRFYPIPLGFAASALKLSFRTLQSFPSCWTKTAAMRELVHVQGGHIFTVCSVVVGHHESFDLDLLFAYTIWTSIHMYWQHLLLITVHWVQLTKIEDFHWTRLFCFTSNGKVSAATRSEPSSGRSLRMNMALTPLVLGLNDWLPLYGCLFLRSAVGLEWIKINEVLCGDELRFWYYIFFGCRWQVRHLDSIKVVSDAMALCTKQRGGVSCFHTVCLIAILGEPFYRDFTCARKKQWLFPRMDNM